MCPREDYPAKLRTRVGLAPHVLTEEGRNEG